MALLFPNIKFGNNILLIKVDLHNPKYSTSLSGSQLLIHHPSKFVAHPARRVLEIAQIAERHVGNEPYVEEAKGQGCHNLPPDEAQIQNEQLPLDARRLPAGEPDGLSSGEGVVGENVVVGEAVAVGGDEPRDNEQHTPQRDADGYLNPAPDQLW